MTSPRRFEQDLPARLSDLYMGGTPDYRDDLVRQTARTRQRHAWTFPERWLPMDIAARSIPKPSPAWRTIAVLAVIGTLLALAVGAFVGSRPRLPDAFGEAANGQVAYTKDGDIYAQDTVDGDPHLIVGGPAVDEAIAFSPRGSRLLLARETEGGYDLLVADPDGTDIVRIGGPYADPGRIEWSPDEAVVAVAHSVDGVETITMVQADGTGERTLEIGMPADEPAWRPPDGGQLAVRGRLDGTWGLYLVNADGKGLTRLKVPRDLLEDPYEALSPAWSPDGRRIAVHRLVDTPGQGNGNGFRITIASVDAAGVVSDVSTPTFAETSDDEFNVSWTPDGTQVVFVRRDGDVNTLAMAPADGLASTDLDLTTSGGVGGIRYSVAPDGRSVLAHLEGAGTDWIAQTTDAVVRSHEIDSDTGATIQRRAP